MNSEEYIDELAELYRTRKALANLDAAIEYEAAIKELQSQVSAQICEVLHEMLEAEE